MVVWQPDDFERRHSADFLEFLQLGYPDVGAQLIANIQVVPREPLVCMVPQICLRPLISLTRAIRRRILRDREFSVIAERYSGTLREIPQISASRLGYIVVGHGV